MHTIRLFLGQCPCSGSGPGIHPLILLALVIGLWQLGRWIKRTAGKESISLMNKIGKISIVVILVAVVAIVIIAKQNKITSEDSTILSDSDSAKPDSSQQTNKPVPRLVDLGASKCIPCKMMAPILEELKEEYIGRMKVEFIDVWENPDEAKKYSVKIIPTQIFYDTAGKELFRHEGFFSREDILGKWKELGHDFTANDNGSANLPQIERWEPARLDDRPRDQVCYMCDGNITTKTLVVVKTDKGDVRLCSPHCYFIMYSCLTEDKTDFENKVSVTDWTTANPVSAIEAVFLYGQDETTGKPWTKAFADRADAAKDQTASGGNILALKALQQKELSHRCGFCDRACYPQDAAEVIVDGGLHTWGCCSHCAMGVAARTGKDIEVHERDRLTGELVTVKTLNGSVASIEPVTAVAWFGMRKKPDDSWGSAGCFHQGFFTGVENLKEWLKENPHETGKLINIHKALADKMKLSPQQISKACKIGECSPK